MKRVPSSPRCKLCAAPFSGLGGAVLRHFGYGRFQGNPSLCQKCIVEFRAHGLTGTEIPVTLLFADVRGSTGIGERMRPNEFRAYLDHFYKIGSAAILRHDGLVDKFVGDEVIGLFFGGVSGPDHQAAAIRAATDLLEARRPRRCHADGAHPGRRRGPYRRGVRRRHGPGGCPGRLHGPRRRGQHDGPAGVRGRGRGAAAERRRGHGRRPRTSRPRTTAAPWTSAAARSRSRSSPSGSAPPRRGALTRLESGVTGRRAAHRQRPPASHRASAAATSRRPAPRWPAGP